MRDHLATGLRTDGAGALRIGDAGREVTLCGWVHRRRDHGGLVFFDLRDRYGLVQCVVNPETVPAAAFREAERIRAEDVIWVEGVVARRPDGSANPDLPNGDIEVRIFDCRMLSETATPPFPIDVEKEGGEVSEETRLRWRFLELRRMRLTSALGMRHRIAFQTRCYLDNRSFWEVETPMLTRRTPEGARDYLVPSRVHPGSFYALPQSPQLYKQMLMVAGYDRYFQIARCFRDEDLRADRQPEFTQIDIEMSFVDQEDVIDTVDGLFRHLFRTCLGVTIGAIPRLTHAEALRRFGTDKPDLRIPHELVDVTEDFQATGFRVFDSVVAIGRRRGCAQGPGRGGREPERHRSVDGTRALGRRGRPRLGSRGRRRVVVVHRQVRGARSGGSRRESAAVRRAATCSLWSPIGPVARSPRWAACGRISPLSVAGSERPVHGPSSGSSTFRCSRKATAEASLRATTPSRRRAAGSSR